MGSEKKAAPTSRQALSEQRLEAFAREYGAALKRYFERRCNSPEIARDLVQEVYLRLAARAGKGEIENPRAYLMQTASSVFADFLRKKQSSRQADHEEYHEAAHSPEGFSPQRVLEGREAVMRVVEALKTLPPRTRQIYLLCRVDGMKRKDVASRLGISVSGVDKHLIAATKKIGLEFGDLE